MTRDAFLSDLLGKLSLSEKIGQLNLLTGQMDVTGLKNSGNLAAKIRQGQCGALLNVFTPAATRALQEIASESPHQIPLIFGYDVIHGHRTIFPIPLGLSCSWNLDLLERCAQVAAAEAAADGLHWVYSPMVDISQDARWGRVAEGSGEDPWLGSKIATAMVRGYQGSDLSDPASVIACVKHFALYGASIAGRDYNTVDMSRREMEETYFPPYRAAINAGARTVMTSFNEIDGIPATGNSWLLTDLLRDQWGFDGWVVTDYTAVSEMIQHGTAANLTDAAHQALNAGVDMDMVAEAYLTELPKLLEDGLIFEAQIDAAVMRILITKWDLGLFKNPYSRGNEQLAAELHLCSENRALARQAARESIVLLKNDDHLLPLKKQGVIAVIGPLADCRREMLGCWIAAGNPAETVSALDGTREKIGDQATIIHAQGCGIETENSDLLAESIRVAEQADVIILVLGESHTMSGEAASRSDIRLPKCQRQLANAILQIGKPCILITLSGRPLDLSWEATKFSSILHAWALGTEGGNAIADILFGDFSPVGKLTMGFPRHVGQLPMTYREKPTGRPFDPANSYTSRYLDVPNDALFPFGHGLTYGEFTLGSPTLSSPTMNAGETITVSIQIKNITDHPATETLQLYLRDRVASVSRPIKELRGFQRISLAAHESRLITFEITDADLAFPGRDLQLIIEPGDFDAMIGSNSSDLQSIRFTRV